MATQAQINAGKAQVLDRMFIRYPQTQDIAIRIAVQYVKNGTALEIEVGKAILQEAYQAIFGISPIGRHHYKQWLRDKVQPYDAATLNTTLVDCFDAV